MRPLGALSDLKLTHPNLKDSAIIANPSGMRMLKSKWHCPSSGAETPNAAATGLRPSGSIAAASESSTHLWFSLERIMGAGQLLTQAH